MNSCLEHEAFLTRRQFFGHSAFGLGTAALASLLNRDLLGADPKGAAVSGTPFLVAKTGWAPSLSVMPDGRVLLVYKGTAREGAERKDANDLYFTTAPRVGAAFSLPVKVASFTSPGTGMRREPRVASDGRSLLVTALKKEEKRLEVQAFHSGDGGRSWSEPVRVAGPKAKNLEGLYAMTASARGTFHVVWLDNRARATQIWHARSSDGGKTWKEQKAFPPGEGAVCECCWPAIAADANGKLFLLVRHNLQNVRDMHVVESSDDGETWPAASQKLGSQSWNIAACPVQGGALDVLSDGTPIAIWAREGEIFTSGISTDERSLGKGRNGSIAAGPDGAYLLWEEHSPQSAPGDIHVAGPGGRAFQFRTQRPQGGPYATSSTIAGHPRAGVLAAWEEDGGIYAAVVATPPSGSEKETVK